MKRYPYISSLLLIGLLALGIIGMKKGDVQNPERLIVGTWHEKSWEYERLESPGVRKIFNNADSLFRQEKTKPGSNLIIHAAEVWEFFPDGSLHLMKNTGKSIVQWRLKGRGNILEIRYGDQRTEHYNISELDKGRLVLNFDSDIHIKGIAKLTFEK